MSTPALAPREHRSRLTGTGGDFEMAWFEWDAVPAQRGAPTILLVHATGFHARCWDQVVKHLEGRHVIAIDVRGHGRSDKLPPFSWDQFGSDLVAFMNERGITGAVGVGHSMGGYSVTEAAAALPEAFSRLVLIDPVILPPDAYAARRQWFEGDEHPTAKRRNQWRNWEEMFERFESRMPFAAWDRAVLEDYCRYGVLPDPDAEGEGEGEGGGFVLACPPKVEASIYMGSAGRDIYAQVAKVQIPVTVLRARERTAEQQSGGAMDFSTSPTFPALASRFPQGRDVHLVKHSHFIPMEDPQLAAEYILGRR